MISTQKFKKDVIFVSQVFFMLLWNCEPLYIQSIKVLLAETFETVN